ncbi:hypothetical protein MB02_15290 [Croceicoccus estronivorus]|uniref:hypothetical protein n=1 Tax=Croceicoccus estronivorus TaxID=1172626 RepID=UPI00083512E6|nr:hypothetical protein [Croceicoccus estronivorus]OCC22771.1 hypothetical protein MB02_15290 [Croceicoccus estronivorus]
MRKLRTALIAGVLTVAAAGAAVAASEHVHVMKVDLPDGGVARIHYTGDVAPKVEFVPAKAGVPAFALPVAFSSLDDEAFFAPFARMDQIMAQMEQRHRAMMQMVAQMDSQASKARGKAAANGTAPVGFVTTGTLPAGTTMHYSFYSSTNGKNGCTQTVEWRSDGSSKQPQVTRASSGDCDSVKPSTTPKPAAAAKPMGKDDTRKLPGNST